MKNTKKEVTFEEAMHRLEEIANLLEQGDTTLDNSIALYEEGAKLAARCSEQLEHARQAIIEINTEKESSGE